MKTYIFDQYAFDTPSSEQTLIVVVANKNQFSTTNDFIERVAIEHHFEHLTLNEANPHTELGSTTFVHNNLQRVGLNISDSWQTVVFSDQWNEICVLFYNADQFIFHYWDTSA